MAKKVYPYELIGQEMEVIDSRNKDNLGLEGKIVDETKNTVKIAYQGKIKTLMKSNITFKLKKNGRIIEGEMINRRPEERLKGK